MSKSSKSKSLLTLAFALIMAGSLCSCAKTGEPTITIEESKADLTVPFVENTVSSDDTQSETEDTPSGYGFFYEGDVKNGDIEFFNDKDFNEYNGGIITYHFNRESFKYPEDLEEGYLIFLDGIPQKVSYDGEEEQFMIISQPGNTKKEITLNITPKITKEMKDKEIFTLRMVSVTGISKQKEDAVFSEQRMSSPFSDIKIKPTVPLEIIEDNDVPSIMPAEFEEILITPQNSIKYNIQDYMDAVLMLNTAGGSWQSMFVLPEGENSIKADCIMYGYGSYTGKYRIFFFQNNEPVKIAGGWDCVDMEIKEGYMTKCEVEFENVNNRDEIFAIATPLDESVRSSFTMSENRLVLSERDPYYIEYKKTA